MMSVRWLIATGMVGLTFGLTWFLGMSLFEMSSPTALQVAAVVAAVVGLPLSWWSFRGQLLDEPAEVSWLTWRRVPSESSIALPRPDEEAHLDEIFRGYKGKSSPVAVITGPSGVGKTQLAAGYARARIAEGWPLVAWINASSPEEMQAGLLEFADALSLRVPEEGSARAIERLLAHPPTGTQPSVIIFDGVVNVEAVRPYLPTAPGWRVLVTSGAPDADTLGPEIPLDLPELAEVTAASGLSEHAAERLGRLPLAVELATATVREHDGLAGDEDAYLRHLDSLAVGELLGDGRDGSRHEENYPLGAVEAILVGLAGAGFETDQLTRRLLGALAVLSPGGVSRELMYYAAHPGSVEETFAKLGRWALLCTRMDGDGVLVHELTRRAVLDRLRAEDALPQVIGEAAGMLGRAIFGEEQAWMRRGEGDHLVAHIAALSTAAGSVSATLPPEAGERVLELRQWATRQLSAVGDGGRAVELAESLRAECEALLGPDHPDTLAASDNVVIAYVAARRSADGIPLAEQVLNTRIRVLGLDHPDTLSSRYTLAYAHEYAGRLDDAVLLYDRAYTEYARVLGPDNQATHDTGIALNRVRHMAPARAAGRHRASQQTD
ncbi:hypothetical protein BKA01_007138 [Pseudonocardia eucalypti]|uniref:tetratricopeptide repeat protein n=1 Tax=Pseudonocardia eucalypti TaxID=648755 RepID=UPI00161B8F4E|nr:hypothetical protein [Pseudonocardia eucalypti]